MDPDLHGTEAYYLFLNEMSVDPDPELRGKINNSKNWSQIRDKAFWVPKNEDFVEKTFYCTFFKFVYRYKETDR